MNNSVSDNSNVFKISLKKKSAPVKTFDDTIQENRDTLMFDVLLAQDEPLDIKMALVGMLAYPISNAYVERLLDSYRAETGAEDARGDEKFAIYVADGLKQVAQYFENEADLDLVVRLANVSDLETISTVTFKLVLQRIANSGTLGGIEAVKQRDGDIFYLLSELMEMVPAGVVISAMDYLEFRSLPGATSTPEKPAA